MDDLRKFLLSEQASWQPQDHGDSFICDNEDILDRLDKIRSYLPDSLQNSKDLRAWKTDGNTRPGSQGSLLPVEIISGVPYILDGVTKTKTTLTADSDPIPFKKGDLISGHLLYIVAST